MTIHISFTEILKFRGYGVASRVLDNITTNFELSVNVVSTDRHLSIKKLMLIDSRFNNIKHQFDLWHIAKGLLKKFMKAASKKGKPSF